MVYRSFWSNYYLTGICSGSAHGGTKYACFPGLKNQTSNFVGSAILGNGPKYLHFWYWVTSSDLCFYDFDYVQIGSDVLRRYQLCTSSNTSGNPHGTTRTHNEWCF
jgi:hypothetical protein